jgi:hypothetical protein
MPASIRAFTEPRWPLSAPQLPADVPPAPVRPSGARPARAPLIVLVLASLIGTAGAAAFAFHRLHQNDVFLVNGFSRSLQVTIGPTSVRVSPGQALPVRLPFGRHAALARTEDGRTVEEAELIVESAGATLVWNVAGAAPIMGQQVVYTVRGSLPSATPVSFCGRRWLSLSVDDAFRPAPRTIETQNDFDRLTRQRLYVAPVAPELDGAQTCAAWLAKRDPAAVAAIRQARAVVMGEP